MTRTLFMVTLSLSGIYAQPTDISSDLLPFMKGGKVPALATAAVLDGKIVAAGAAGIRKHGDPTPVTINDKFHIGSCTKSMTGALAAMLVADGRITWQTTVAEVFTDMEIHPGFRQATLLQLASNSGGVPRDIPTALWIGLVADQEKPEAAERMRLVRSLLKNPPAYPPGTAHVYSNGGFTIGGAMLEKVSGMSYADLIEARLFGPLKINTAGFGAPASAGNVDQPYGHVRRFGIFPRAIPPGPEADNPPAITPSGRVHLSILDFARYASFQLGTAENSPLPLETLKFLHTPVPPPGNNYAVGWVSLERDWAGGTALFHNGSNTMSYAVMWLAPAKKFAVVAVCNIDSGIGPEACDAAASMMIERFLK